MSKILIDKSWDRVEPANRIGLKFNIFPTIRRPSCSFFKSCRIKKFKISRLIRFGNKTRPQAQKLKNACSNCTDMTDISHPNAFGMGPIPEGVGITALTDTAT